MNILLCVGCYQDQIDIIAHEEERLEVLENDDTTEQYLGNPNLKKANVATNFTPEEVQEYIKCSEDPVYFIQTYIKIVSLDKGLIPFDMYDFQVDMTRSFMRIDLILLSYLVSLVNQLSLLHTFSGMFFLMRMLMSQS